MTYLRFTSALVLALSLAACAGKSKDIPPPSSGTECQPVTCEILCTNGFKKDANGCEICECA
jgi:hypothetical protein